MTRLYGCSLLFAAMTTTALAGGYSDFNAGIAARNRGDNASAIRLLSSAINALDLPKQVLYAAYFDRGSAYLDSKQPSAAIADLSACLAISPNYVPALAARGEAYQRSKDYDHAQKDFEAMVAARPDLANGQSYLVDLNIERKTFDAALKISNDTIAKWPRSDTPFIMRGDVYRAMGEHDKAMDDYDSAVSNISRSAEARIARAHGYEDAGDLRRALLDLDEAADYLPAESDVHEQMGMLQWGMNRFDDSEKTFQALASGIAPSPYAFLWLYLSQAREDAGAHPQLAAGTAKLDTKKWPGPLISLYSGGMTSDGALKAAFDSDPATQSAQTCEANFYVGEWQLLNAAPAEATKLLTEAAHGCGPDTIERTGATAELARTK